MSIENGIRQDDTWIAVDPIVGCAKNCQYCFLQIYGATPKGGEVILSPDEAIDNLIHYETYNPDATIMLGSETDVFMSKPNIDYFTNFIQRYDERNIGNPVAFVTKCHISDEFIHTVENLQNTRVIFYLSYSGLPKTIEPTTNTKRLKENFVRLHNAGQDVVHYWRPFLPQNSSPQQVRDIIDHVAKYARCTVAAGIKLNSGILDNVKRFWPELAKEDIDFSNISAVWPEGVRDYLRNYVVSTYPTYPLYWVNSCALAYVLDIPEFNGIYKSQMCLEASCPSSQRNLCTHFNEDYIPTESAVQEAIGKMGITSRTHIDVHNRKLVIEGELEHSQIVYLTQRLNFPVIGMAGVKSENEWGGPVIGRQDLHIPFSNEFDYEF